VIGYVVMPEHFHLLIGEPRRWKRCGGYAGSETTGSAAVPSQGPISSDK
jgi:hypothetical protein